MDDYVKVVYQSEPIGEERIILYLTTFDTKKFEKEPKKDLSFWEDLKLSIGIFCIKSPSAIIKYNEWCDLNPKERTKVRATIENKGWCYWGGRRDKE